MDRYDDMNASEVRTEGRARLAKAAFRNAEGKIRGKSELVDRLRALDAVAVVPTAPKAPAAPVEAAPLETPKDEAVPEAVAPAPRSEASAPEKPRAAEPDHFRVMEDAQYVIGGVVTTLAAGTVVSARSHDLADVGAQLDSQGIALMGCGAPVAARDAYGRTRASLFGPPVPSTRRQQTADQELNPNAQRPRVPDHYEPGTEDVYQVRVHPDGHREIVAVNPPPMVTTPDGREIEAQARTADGRIDRRR